MQILLFLTALAFLQDEGHRSIAERHEKEGRWKEALEAYEKARDERPRGPTCGTCRGFVVREIRLSQARCLARLGRPSEGLAIVDSLSLEGDTLISPRAIRAVIELTQGTDREREFQDRFSNVVPRFYYPATAVNGYTRLYKAELEKNAEAMLDILVAALPQPSLPFRRDRWEAWLETQGWVGAEAIACLARIHEKSIPLLKRLVTADGKSSRTALLALASMNHSEASELFKDTAWVPESVNREFLKECARFAEIK